MMSSVTSAPTTSLPARSGHSIRAALAKHAPEELTRFDADFHDALQVAGLTFDTTTLDAVLQRWRGIAALLANPLTAEEHELMRRVRTGDDRGLWEQAEDGTFHRLG